MLTALRAEVNKAKAAGKLVLAAAAFDNQSTKNGNTMTDGTLESYYYNIAKAMYPVLSKSVKINANSGHLTWWRGTNGRATDLKDFYDTLNKAWSAAFDYLKDSDKEALRNFYDDAVKFLEKYFPDLISEDGILAPNGFVAFFQKIAEFFQKIMDFFKGLFGG